MVSAARLAAGGAAFLRRLIARPHHLPHPADGRLRLAVVVLLVWFRGGPGWQGLLSALVGMAAGGGLIWLVRIIGTAALGREAMGFGDVTLMAMIGAFLGWQPCLLIFFLAPVAGLVVGVLRLLLMRDREIPYGPFLCLATLFVIVGWNGVWDWSQQYFALGWLVPLVMLGCLLLMAVMLAAWRLILTRFGRLTSARKGVAGCRPGISSSSIGLDRCISTDDRGVSSCRFTVSIVRGLPISWPEFVKLVLPGGSFVVAVRSLVPPPQRSA